MCSSDLSIMGRSESEAESDTSMLFYPAMQVTDIYALEVDLALGGMDQRHAHMLARDAASSRTSCGKLPMTFSIMRLASGHDRAATVVAQPLAPPEERHADGDGEQSGTDLRRTDAARRYRARAGDEPQSNAL